jgi:hypothetical protein
VPVVDNFLADIERFFIDIESDVHDVYCSHDAGTKTARLGKENLFERHGLNDPVKRFLNNQYSVTNRHSLAQVGQ